MSMRTRFLDSMTNAEVTDYLARNDIIFLPVGTIEMHGEMPLGCEHVLPLAVASRLAEAVDGLVLPGLVYFYPGATAVGRGTIQISPGEGAAYLKAICRSLLRQGFRRQILLSYHGPAYTTVAPMVREFFDETKCPIVYIDLEEHQGGDGSWEQFNKMLWGAYHLLGRLDEIPRDQQTGSRSRPPRMLQGRFHYGCYYSQASDHGWWPERSLTEEERLARAQEGAAMIGALAERLNPRQLVAGMKEMDEYIQSEVLPKHGPHLP